MKLNDREKEIIYFVLSREIEKSETQKEFNELDTLRDKFKESRPMAELKG